METQRCAFCTNVLPIIIQILFYQQHFELFSMPYCELLRCETLAFQRRRVINELKMNGNKAV